MDESTLSIAISGTKINRQAKIKPAGFWSDDCIIVTQVRSYRHGTYKFHDPLLPLTLNSFVLSNYFDSVF